MPIVKTVVTCLAHGSPEVAVAHALGPVAVAIAIVVGVTGVLE